MALSNSKKVICIIKKNNIKTSWCFLLFNFFHSFRTENKLKSQEKRFEKKDSCWIVMPSEKDKILEFKHYMKYITYKDIEYLIKK